MDASSDLIFLYACFLISIGLLAIAGILNPIFVIRLQLQQAKVRNGLANLRRQMLTIGIFAEVVIIASIICLTIRFFTNDPFILRHIIPVAIVLFSAFVLGIILLFIQVYNQNYTERNKELHSLIAEIEEEAIKKAKEQIRIDKRLKK